MGQNGKTGLAGKWVRLLNSEKVKVEKKFLTNILLLRVHPYVKVS